MLRYTIPLIVFTGLVLFFAVGLQRDPRQVPSPFIGKPAPELGVPQLRTPDKEIYRSDLLGKPALINVWASWCVACRAEHEVLIRLARETQLPIIGLNYKDERGAALQWLANLGDPYTAIAVDTDGQVGIEWGVYGVPESFLLDPKGVIRYKQIGPLTWKVVEDKLFPLIQSFGTQGG
ncbi:DsbE family thiol:disulfide interchange protein [Nitrosococcus watsonii]|uniref:Periplasmic protein thiol/disulfide oxidoreductase DsbE n=1 Tax=Nitrosococcus watsoni (strain C-113) TaxID=105559 RepID=D8K465_NITWC|nr:DsbE family thiol:disulfide interchange protein [Nitrosococcus watsonii]ADJ27762.1 periplasmic protein thiol/disulfide oxidoreductase DsbE [Nitrosococcus watsonii C-113]